MTVPTPRRAVHFVDITVAASRAATLIALGWPPTLRVEEVTLPSPLR